MHTPQGILVALVLLGMDLVASQVSPEASHSLFPVLV
jgi:hypothetical protein